jgi:hypothetical protein
MPLAHRTRIRLIAALSSLVGAAMAWGGGQEAVVYFFEDPLPVGIGALGALMGLMMVVAAIGLWTARPAARRLCFASAGGTMVVTAAGMIFRFIGMSGAIIGVAAPLLVMAALAATPGGAGRASAGEPSSPADRPEKRSGLPRVAAVH